VLFGGAVFPIFAAIYYWVPKMWGRLMDERLGKLSFWVIFLGFNLTFFPMHVLGLLGMPRRIYTYHPGLGWDLGNLLSTVGADVLGLGILITVANFILSRRRGAPAGPDPWGGESLEWATSSPPPPYDFVEIPTVRSAEPLWDQPELRQAGILEQERLLAAEHETLSTSVLDADPELLLPMPEESYTPVATALGLSVMFAGVLLSIWPVAIVGVVLSLLAMATWHRIGADMEAVERVRR
jgi:cytochrome c oxidase subunit I+III